MIAALWIFVLSEECTGLPVSTSFWQNDLGLKNDGEDPIIFNYTFEAVGITGLFWNSSNVRH